MDVIKISLKNWIGVEVYALSLRVLTSRLRRNDEAFAFIVFPCFYCLPRAGGDPGYLKKTHHFG